MTIMQFSSLLAIGLLVTLASSYSAAAEKVLITLVEPCSTTVLGNRAIEEFKGKCTTDSGRRWVEFTGEGELIWNITVPQPGRYEVIAAYGSLTSGERFDVSVAGTTIQGKVQETMGLYDNKGKPPKNFERFVLDGVLDIPEGEHTVSLRVDQSLGSTWFRLNLLELVPVDYKDATLADQAEAERQRASTDWFADAKYGVMFHWTTESLPHKGETKSYAEAVRDFDVPAFVEMVEKTGASYVLFTAMHGDPTFPAPIKEWEEAFPGMTTERDLIGEIADALGRRKIKLGLYFASGPMGKDIVGGKARILEEDAYLHRRETDQLC